MHGAGVRTRNAVLYFCTVPELRIVSTTSICKDVVVFTQQALLYFASGQSILLVVYLKYMYRLSIYHGGT